MFDFGIVKQMKLTAETQRTQSITEKKGGGNIKSPFLRVPSVISAPLR